MNKLFVVFVLNLSVLIPAQAIRHVGNAGGEAELRILQMAESLPVWMKACDENPGTCWSHPEQGRRLTESLKLSLQNLGNIKIQFIEEGRSSAFCQNQTLSLSSENLYADPRTSQSDGNLAKILIQGILQCQGLMSADLSQLNLRVYPLAKNLAGTSVFYLQEESTDLLTGLQTPQNLHKDLQTQLSCERYRILDTQGFLKVHCEDRNEVYRVEVRESPGRVQLISRYSPDENGF